jgi:hypothetical protein
MTEPTVGGGGGKGTTAATILATDKSKAPSEVQVFPNALGQYSTRTTRR